jgi:hypothetical protein
MSRISQISRFVLVSGTLTEDTTQRTNYYYDANPFDTPSPYYSHYTYGRLAAVHDGGGHCTTIGPHRTGCDNIQE